MESTNGHQSKRVILYARVSTDEQARSGYSLAQQLEALREYAVNEGYEVLEEVVDPGHSGASLERPGMDRVRDLVATGGVSLVLAQDRDRFTREPAYHYLLRQEFEKHGCKLKALNDRSDDTPEGELTDGILDQLAKFERAKIAERTRRGLLRKAREGKVIANGTSDYGFKYNAARNGYEVDEEKMRVVRRIFHLIGVEGKAIHAVKVALERDGIPSPGGAPYWNKTFIRKCILDDVYRPHTFEEIEALVSADVAAWLDPENTYGVWWFNRQQIRYRQVSENTVGDRTYRRRSTTITRPKEDWIAVPVPHAGIPGKVVDAAREVILKNRPTSSAGRRFWELSGGILYCSGCGRRMLTHAVTGRRNKRRYFYYRCSKVMEHGRDACRQNKGTRADVLEPRVWGFISGILRDPEKIRAGLDAMIEEERDGLQGNSEREVKARLNELAEADRMRSGYQELAAKGLMSLDELGTKLQELEETRKTARRELEAVSRRRKKMAELEWDRDTLLESYVQMIPAELDDLSPEERHRVYTRIRLRVEPAPDGSIDVSGTLTGAPRVLVSETAPGDRSRSSR